MMYRREFLKVAGGVITQATLAALGVAQTTQPPPQPANRRRDYGELRRTADTDGRVVLALPEGFQYATFSRTGDPYTHAPALTVPRSHDGMACFRGSGNTVRLIRNHELRNPAGNFTLGVSVPAHLRYDAQAMGGCMTLDFDVRTKRLVRQFASLGGTMVNCSGGWSYANAGWLTCEETTAGVQQDFKKPHGYAFLVPASAERAVAAVPLKALGRFSKEAAVADASGIVYQTEDAGNTSGFYRFVPDTPGSLTRGKLQMLALKENPAANLYSGQAVGAPLPVTWVDIVRPDPDLELDDASCFAQGRERGGAAFNRLEGIYRGEDARSVYFVSTSGGDVRGPGGRGYGQLWRYAPADPAAKTDDELTLVFESPSGSVLESPDNLCITPRGGILFCEDDAVGDADTHPLASGIVEVNRLIGLGAARAPFTFAVNVLNASELAGACFSPDGDILFVNLFGDATRGSGMTCAIWGPWERGPL